MSDDPIKFLDSSRQLVYEKAVARYESGKMASIELDRIGTTCIVPELPGWTVQTCLDRTDQILDMASDLLSDAPPNMRWVAVVAVRLVPHGE